jgi:alanine-alpha-ketoisovalerate/valine-pyruvate aminotransferase
MAKILTFSSRFPRLGENRVIVISYSKCGRAIHVDMIRKVAIIAVSGNIGKPFFHRTLQLLEQELNNRPLRMVTTLRCPTMVSCGVVREE